MQARVIATKDKFAKIEMLDGSVKEGQTIQISIGKKRTRNQNNYYWLLLQWAIDNGLREQGHFCVEALHEDLKSNFLSEKVYTDGEWKVIEESIGSTAGMSKIEFGEYVDKVKYFMISFFSLDLSDFEKQYLKWTN